MDPVAHPVRLQSAADLQNERLVLGDFREGQRLGRGAKAIQVLDQLEDPAAVEPQALPNRVSTLYGGVEGADARLVAVYQPSVDAHEQIPVSFVEALKHGRLVPQAVSR